MLEEQEEISINGKLASTSENFRKYFLLLFTKELIKQSNIEEFFKLQHTIKKTEQEKRAKRAEEPKKSPEDFNLSIMHRAPITIQRENAAPAQIIFKPLQKQAQVPLQSQNQITSQVSQNRAPQRVGVSPQIPEYPLPQRLQYLRPYATNIQIDLARLNPLVQDPAVRSIECNGPSENLLIKSSMGTRTINITLNKDEIDDIFQRFSETSRIPIHEGIFKIAAGNLILSAIVSEVVGSKFIIRKMAAPQMGRGYY